MCDLMEGAEIIREHEVQMAAGKLRYEYEYTDLFGGQANYSWVKRGHFYARSDAEAVRMAKAAVGLTGMRCDRDMQGWGNGGLALRPRGSCTVLFVELGDDPK